MSIEPSLVRGVLATDAVRRIQSLRSLQQAKDQLEAMRINNFAMDEGWERVWEEKARKLGTYDEILKKETEERGEGEGRCSMYRVKDLASRLALSLSKVYQLIRSGEMPHFKIGGAESVSEEQFQKFLAGA